jgi:hypothetical protein
MFTTFPDLRYPPIDVRLKKDKQQFMVFDIIRKKWIVLTPEEWVRQHIIHWFINHHKVSPALLSVEKEVILNGTKKRYDIVVYSKTLQPILVVECKAPEVNLTESTVEQALRYNLELNAPYFFVSNGLTDALFKSNLHGIEVLTDWKGIFSL